MNKIVAATLTLLHLLASADCFGSCPWTAGGRSAAISTVLFSKDNQAMSFLRRKGLVGGTKDFTNAIGIDEGPAGKNGPAGRMVRKASNSYKSCIESGVIDDITEAFPLTSSGTEWSGFSDRVMGGVSVGSLVRDVVQGRDANVLRGEVSLANNGGFIQMAVDLANDPSKSRLVDAMQYDGIELDVLCKGDTETETFNVHLKTPDCVAFASYRSTFELTTNADWETIRIPWSDFHGKGPGAENVAFDPSRLRRIGVVAIGREMIVYLALSKLGFYSVV